METVSNEILSMIIERGTARDQFVTYRLINSRFYSLSPVIRYRNLNMDEVLLFSPKLQRELPGFWNGDAACVGMITRAYIDLMKYIIDFNSDGLRKIRFTNQIPINLELMEYLTEVCPNLTDLNFTMRYDRNIIIPIEPLTVLPKFPALSVLRLNYNIGADFEPILARLRLRKLEIGGSNAPIRTADNALLKELTILAPDPNVYKTDLVYRLSDIFPNLTCHRMFDFFGGHVICPNDFAARGGFEMYRRFKNMRQSDYIDTFLGQFMENRGELSIDFPNLRKIHLLSSIEFDGSTDTLRPAFPTFCRLTSLSFHLTADSREFFKAVLTTNCNLKFLTVSISFGGGSYLLEKDLEDGMPFSSRLKALCIQGYDGLPLLAKFWYNCRNLRVIRFIDKSIIQQEHIFDFENSKKSFDGCPPKLEKLILRCDVSCHLLRIFCGEGRLKKLGQLTLNVYEKKQENQDELIRLLVKRQFPLLRVLCIEFPPWWRGSTKITQSFLRSLRKLRKAVLINLDYGKSIWKLLGVHPNMERFSIKLCVGQRWRNREKLRMKDFDELSTTRQNVIEDWYFNLPWLKLQMYETKRQDMIFSCPEARCWVEHKGRRQFDLDAMYDR